LRLLRIFEGAKPKNTHSLSPRMVNDNVFSDGYPSMSEVTPIEHLSMKM